MEPRLRRLAPELQGAGEWADVPSAPDTRIVELFPCSGGFAEGLRRAGLSVSVAFDWDDDACASYAANLGHAPIKMNVRDLVRMARAGMLCSWWRDGPIDLLIADPPCTPWSRAGKRGGLDDERDMLVETIDLIRILRPKRWLVANVPGLDDGPNWPVVQRTIGSLASEGYCIDFARLDAANYGVPQHRVRPFWFGHCVGPMVERPTACVQWPASTHGDPKEIARALPLPGIAPLHPWTTCRQALNHLDPDELGSPVRLRWRDRSDHRPSRADRPARTLTKNSHSDGALLTHPRHPISRANQPSYTITTKGDGRGAQGACVLEWPWDVPSTTVTCRAGLAPPGHHPEEGSVMTMPGAIKLSEKAAAILQGFPPGWVFAGKTKRARWAQIGMAMPPPLAEAVGRAIVRAMSATTTPITVGKESKQRRRKAG